MIVNVKLFAVAKQLAGSDVVAIELPENATVGQLRRKLGEQVPPLQPLLGQVLFAVDTEYASDQAEIPASAEVACIPPVSGG